MEKKGNGGMKSKEAGKNAKPETLQHMITRVTVASCIKHGNPIPEHVKKLADKFGIKC